MDVPVKCCGQCAKSTLTQEGDLCKETGEIVNGCEPPCENAISPLTDEKEEL